MIYLDTHALVWLYQKDKDRFTLRGRELIEREELRISPMVELELEYLYEINRISVKSREIINYLEDRLELTVCTRPFPRLAQLAATFKWTRDPFDRLITSQAALKGSLLLTKDRAILKHYSGAVW